MRTLALLVLIASTAHADGDRARVDAKLTSAVAELTCGKPKASYDWRAYDAIDWSAASKDKSEWLAFERGTLDSLGRGLNNLCTDADYKALIGSIHTIVYQPTGDKTTKLIATLSGTTLTFRNYIFGSTRDVGDFADAARAAFDKAPAATRVAEVRVKPAAANLAAASSAWDGKYAMAPIAITGGLCPRADRTGPLVVTNGKFSFQWFVDDWTDEKSRAPKAIKVGRVDGTVHADGSAATMVTFGEPVLKSSVIKTVKTKRELDAVKSVPIKFTRGHGGRVAKLDAKLFGASCEAAWELPDPTPKPTALPSRPTNVAPRPTNAPRADVDRRAEEEREKKSREDMERFAQRARCHASCETKNDQCRENRCYAPRESCRTRCDSNSDSDAKRDCYSDCGDAYGLCKSGCSDEDRTCHADCNR